jgi:phage tail-like protein
MRGTVEGLRSPHPLVRALPSVYADDDFAGRFTAALDEVLAPVFGVLDSWPAYLDPRTAPEDHLVWLGEWLGVAAEPATMSARARELVAGAVELHRRRGTSRGLREILAVTTGAVVEITESGGVAASTEPGTAAPGGATAEVVVRLAVADPDAEWLARADRLVASLVPAHVGYRVEVVTA